MSAWVAFGAAAAALLCAAACSGNARAQDGKTTMLKPGLWRVTSQLWLDGKEVLGAVDAAGARATAEVLRNARAGMSPAERAEFDRNFQPPQRESARLEMECITAEEAGMSPQAALRNALQAVQQPPWTCGITNARSSATDHSFDYRCSTPANALAEGKARFETSTDRRYRSTIVGRSHLVDMQTGRPLDSRIVAARALTVGVWQAEGCQP
jgi:hypothetical protein